MAVSTIEGRVETAGVRETVDEVHKALLGNTG